MSDTNNLTPQVAIKLDKGVTSLSANRYHLDCSRSIRIQFIAFKYRGHSFSETTADSVHDFYALVYFPVFVVSPATPGITLDAYVAAPCVIHPDHDASDCLCERLIHTGFKLPHPYKNRVSRSLINDFSFTNNPTIVITNPTYFLDFPSSPVGWNNETDMADKLVLFLRRDRTFKPILNATLLEPVEVAFKDVGSFVTAPKATFYPMYTTVAEPAVPAPAEEIGQDEEVADEY